MFVGLLGEVPVNKPSLYSQLNVQCAILSVYLAAVAQQASGVSSYVIKAPTNVSVSRLKKMTYMARSCVL